MWLESIQLNLGVEHWNVFIWDDLGWREETIGSLSCGMFKHVGTNTWPIQIIWGCMCSEQSEGKPKVWAHVYKSTKYIHRKLGTIGLRCEELKLFEQHYAGSFASHTMFWVHSYKHAHCLGCPLDIGQHSCLERNEWNSQQSRSSIKDKWLYSILTYTYRSKCPTPLGLRWPAVENTWVDWGCNWIWQCQ